MSRKFNFIKSIHHGIPYFYCTFQYENDCPDNKHTNYLLNEYLQQIKILFDDEAEKDIQKNDHDGGAWYLEV